MMEKGRADFKDNLVAPVYVPESLTGMELLENFRKTDTPVALVVDEYGEVQGIVTPRDVLEAIAGEFKPEQPGDAWSIIMPASVPEEDFGRYNTLAGMMMLLLGRLPKEGDVAEWDGWRLEIIDMDRRRIDKVLAVKVKTAPKQEGRGE